MSNYAKIKKFNISNGYGIRTAIFFSGCDIHCEDCFNQELWNPEYGKPFTKETQFYIFNTMSEHIDGISILGGEPLSEYNLETVTSLCRDFKICFPNKTIWLWTGKTLENILDLEVLKYIDVLVDGKYMKDLKDKDLVFRGSSNQRILYKGEDF